MKKTLIVVVLIALILIAIWLRKNPQGLMNSNPATLSGDMVSDTGMVEDVMSGAMVEITTNDTMNTGDSTSEDTLSPELQAKLEEQATVGLSGQDLTEEEIKLIEDILNQVTDSVQK